MKDPKYIVEAVDAASEERIKDVFISALVILDNPVLMESRTSEELVEFLVSELSQTTEDDIAAIRAQSSPEEIAFYEEIGLLD